MRQSLPMTFTLPFPCRAPDVLHGIDFDAATDKFHPALIDAAIAIYHKFGQWYSADERSKAVEVLVLEKKHCIRPLKNY